MPDHPTLHQLESALEQIKDSPTDRGRVEMISARTAVGQRALLEEGKLDTENGLYGDNWKDRANPSMAGDT